MIYDNCMGGISPSMYIRVDFGRAGTVVLCLLLNDSLLNDSLPGEGHPEWCLHILVRSQEAV